MKLLPIVGSVIRRKNITEIQKIIAVSSNVVIQNEAGFYHTISFEQLRNDYVGIAAAEPEPEPELTLFDVDQQAREAMRTLAREQEKRLLATITGKNYMEGE